MYTYMCIYVGVWQARHYQGYTVENQGYLFIYICLDVRVILYSDPRVFVFARRSTVSHIPLNRILWFINL